jgi:hypothetical protein
MNVFSTKWSQLSTMMPFCTKTIHVGWIKNSTQHDCFYYKMAFTWIPHFNLSFRLCPIFSNYDKFWNLKADYLRTNSTTGFLDPLPRNSDSLILGFYIFLRKMSVLQLISQINSKLQMFQKYFSYKVIAST